MVSVAVGKRKLPRPDIIREIRVLLGLASNQAFPRCPAKAITRVRSFEEKGDFSHSPRRHKCSLCQCRYVAGFGTKGNFWKGNDPELCNDPDWTAAGHYGVGYCYVHDIRGRSAKYSSHGDLNMEMARGIMAMGYDRNKDYEQLIHEQEQMSELALRNRETLVSGLQLTRDFFSVWFDPKQAHKLTERGRGGEEVPMTSKTKAELLIKANESLAKLQKIYSAMNLMQGMSLDQLRVIVPRMLKDTAELKEHAKTQGATELDLAPAQITKLNNMLDKWYDDWHSMMWNIWSRAIEKNETDVAREQQFSPHRHKDGQLAVSLCRTKEKAESSITVEENAGASSNDAEA